MTFLEEIITKLESDPEFFPMTHTHCYYHNKSAVIFVDINGNNANLYRSFGRTLEISSSGVFTSVEYETALAASKKVVWSGEGLPPVGCDVEFNLDTDKYRVNGVIPENGQAVNVVAHKVTTDGNSVAVVYWDDRGAGRAAAFIKEAFRPIRTEAERNREESIRALEMDEDATGFFFARIEAEAIYDAIAAGKIPHITLK